MRALIIGAGEEQPKDIVSEESALPKEMESNGEDKQNPTPEIKNKSGGIHRQLSDIVRDIFPEDGLRKFPSFTGSVGSVHTTDDNEFFVHYEEHETLGFVPMHSERGMLDALDHDAIDARSMEVDVHPESTETKNETKRYQKVQRSFEDRIAGMLDTAEKSSDANVRASSAGDLTKVEEIDQKIATLVRLIARYEFKITSNPASELLELWRTQVAASRKEMKLLAELRNDAVPPSPYAPIRNGADSSNDEKERENRIDKDFVRSKISFDKIFMLWAECKRLDESGKKQCQSRREVGSGDDSLQNHYEDILQNVQEISDEVAAWGTSESEPLSEVCRLHQTMMSVMGEMIQDAVNFRTKYESLRTTLALRTVEKAQLFQKLFDFETTFETIGDNLSEKSHAHPQQNKGFTMCVGAKRNSPRKGLRKSRKKTSTSS